MLEKKLKSVSAWYEILVIKMMLILSRKVLVLQYTQIKSKSRGR